MDLEKACIIHRNSSFGRGRFWLEIWHVGAFWCAQSRFAEGLSFEGEEEGGWLACLWLCVQIIWGLWKGCGLWSRKELDTMDGWWIPTYRQVCSIIFWLNVIKTVLKSSFVDVILLLLWMEVSSAICFRNISHGFALYTRVKEIEVLYFHGTLKNVKTIGKNFWNPHFKKPKDGSSDLKQGIESFLKCVFLLPILEHWRQ